MSAYMHFDGFVGGVTVGTHAGWTKLEAIELVASPPVASQAVRGQGRYVITTVDHNAAAVFWPKACLAGQHIPEPRSSSVVKLDFTSPDGRGGEVTELSVALHGVVMERDYTIPWSSSGSAADDRFRLWFSRITRPMMPSSSPDVSHFVRLALMRMGGASAHAGGVNVSFADGSVRFIR